jgi:biotin transporter BioY
LLTKERTATLSQAILPAPSITAYASLALILALLAAVFEALFPMAFSLISPFSWSSVLKDGAKNLGIVLGIGLGLAYAGHVAKGLFGASSSQAATFTIAPTEPSAWTELLGDAVRVMAFSFLITIFARISIHFGDNPVPITGQTLAVLLTGAVLGARLGVLATLAYMCQGMAGMHVFAGGAFGFVWQLSSGGYIIGFVAAAFVIGFLAERGWNRGAPLLVAMLLGNVLLYVPGLLQLGFFVPWEKVLSWGLYPFIPGDLAKLYVASLLVPAGYWVLMRYRLGERPAWT